MKNLKLTDKELILIINALTEKIRYKGIQKLLVNMQNQLQEQNKEEDEPCTLCGYYEDNIACHYEDCPTQLTDTE